MLQRDLWPDIRNSPKNRGRILWWNLFSGNWLRSTQFEQPMASGPKKLTVIDSGEGGGRADFLIDNGSTNLYDSIIKACEVRCGLTVTTLIFTRLIPMSGPLLEFGPVEFPRWSHSLKRDWPDPVEFGGATARGDGKTARVVRDRVDEYPPATFGSTVIFARRFGIQLNSAECASVIASPLPPLIDSPLSGIPNSRTDRHGDRRRRWR